MAKGPEDYFKVFENPITYVFKGKYELDTKINIINGRSYRPHNQYSLRIRFKTDQFESSRSSTLRPDEFRYFQDNQDTISPFIMIQPLVCYQKEEVPLEAMSMRSLFSEYERPISLDKPVHPSELPTSMKGTKFYDVLSLTKDEEGGRVYLASGLDLSQWYLLDVDYFNGARSLPEPISIPMPLEDIVEIEEMLEKEQMDGSLHEKSKIIGRAVMIFNHKDFGMNNFLQLPEKY